MPGLRRGLRKADGASEPPFNGIKLRRTEAVCGRCIDFHRDVSLRTMQMPLNDESEYVGGRLVYAHADGRVSVPTRTPGSATIHDCEIVHGVTEMVAGVRRALFFLQTPGPPYDPRAKIGARRNRNRQR